MLTKLSDPAPPSEISADGGSTIRTFAADDAREVANLLVSAFQKTEAAAPEGMVAYLKHVYLDAPWYDPDIASRVLLGPNGRVAGFVGVSAMPMKMGDRQIRTAIVSSLAVDARVGDSMIGPRLLRHVRSGTQDAILSDRSNMVAVALMRSMRGEVFRNYSFDWIRALRPVGLAIETMASRFSPLRALAPLAAPFDNRTVARGLRSEAPLWSAPSHSRTADLFSDHDADLAELLELIPRFTAAFPMRPEWSNADLTTILTDAAQKAEYGPFTARVVLSPTGEPAGLFLYHLRRGRVAHLLQLMAAKGREGIVIDRAIAHAAANGAVAIRGRSHPSLLDALMERRAIFVPDLATVVYSRDAEIMKHFREGTAFFTGLAGENWMRLNGDRF